LAKSCLGGSLQIVPFEDPARLLVRRQLSGDAGAVPSSSPQSPIWTRPSAADWILHVEEGGDVACQDGGDP
jgi:hypothetical protein